MCQSPVILIVGTTCTEPGKDAEFNRWYNDVHIPEVLKVPGMISATRYENMEPDKDSPCFLAIWELEDEEAVKKFKDHLRRQRNKEIPDFTWGPKFDIKTFKPYRRIAR